jgi:aldehyde dehydrogenase (NAD+)
MNVLAHPETNDRSKQASFENCFYNIVEGEKVSARKTLPVIHHTTGTQLGVVPDVDRTLLNKAIGAAQNAVSRWGAVPFGRRKAILTRVLSKIDEHADKLCSLLTAEQGGLSAQARWEMDLLTKAYGPAILQMAVHEKERDRQHIRHITKRYVPIDGSDAISLWKLQIILSFGKVLPALLAGDTVVLRPSALTPLTVLRISEYIHELLPPGVFNVVTGGHDLWPWPTTHSGIDLISFTRSTNVGKRVLKSATDTLKPATLELEENNAPNVLDANPQMTAFFGSIVVFPVIWKPGRWGLASVHKYLRPCDLCKELALGTSTRK